MYELDINYVCVNYNDLSKAFDYIIKNRDKDEVAKNRGELEHIIEKLNLSGKKYIRLHNSSIFLTYMKEMYKEALNIKMIENSILWDAMANENKLKFKLEFLYKNVMLDILKNNSDENLSINKHLENMEELFEHILYTQSISDYLEDDYCKEKIVKKLNKNLNR